MLSDLVLLVEVVQSLNLIQIQSGLDFKKDFKIRKDILFAKPALGCVVVFSLIQPNRPPPFSHFPHSPARNPPRGSH
jgi:hypothetical protein